MCFLEIIGERVLDNMKNKPKSEESERLYLRERGELGELTFKEGKID